MKKHIPNLITLLNLFSGCVAVLFAVHGNLEYAAYFVFLGIFFDYFDGFAARMLHVQSELGLQLDSLADMVTSGVVPGVAMFQLLQWSTGSVMPENSGWDHLLIGEMNFLPFVGLCITLASAYRLANFNIDENQTSSFIGLPTPANTLLILSFPLILQFQNSDSMQHLVMNKWFLLILTALSCYMLNAKIPLFALKFKTFGFKENAIRYIFLILSVIMLITMQFMAIPLIIVTYVLLSLLTTVLKK
ncbi:CDP-diacylglycerol---serine O-phosphatidyltransferase [Pustulibacterium marinum]|uniref:CDP-diacylglycerol---serine O-phosphatidyltransferase n=1 Tax=Pustulibacterium marinum TaxID=1224947 RepID=A0A1I7HNJ1_9FLAO|nr:CDP-alcohol phosphatidyltransferase family protein [Pustulibacterium marinum]SFU62191.1 CDP-diacylglycerol---serine O-phosphatidyltransferase [Pustulibacterium marinum]